MARKQFNDTVKEAIDDVIEHGFDSALRIAEWIDKLRQAAEAAMTSQAKMEQMLREALAAIYRRQIENAGIIKRHEGVDRFTLQNVKPQLHAELTRRIMASADLIKLNRERAIAETLERFQGWATSIPKGGTDAASKPKVKKTMRKAMVSLPFRERRVLIDQSQKFNASLSEIVAKDGGAIAGVWRSHFRQVGYDFRPDHKERDGEFYLVMGSWAHRNGLVKPSAVGYVDDVTKPGEEVFCFPGDVSLELFDDAEKVYRRWYSGPIVTIRTAVGSSFRATPNHPIMTPHGWVAAGLLNEGDSIIEIGKEESQLSKLNANQTNFTFAQLFNAVSEVGFAKETRNGMSVDFHGDGAAGENIDIVSLARPLRLDRASSLLQMLNDLSLSYASLLLSGFRSIYQMLFWSSLSSERSLGELGVSYLIPVGYHSASRKETVVKCRPRYMKRFGEFGSAFAIFIAPFNLFPIQKYFLNSTKARAKIDKPSFMPVPDSHDADPAGVRNFINGLSSGAQSVNIVGVNRDHFSGHVYNLQTASGWYVVNGIIVSNCRCFYKWVYSLHKLPPEMLTEKGKEALRNVSASQAA